MKNKIAFAFYTFIFCAQNLAFGSSCAIIGKAGSSVIVNKENKPLPIRLSNCEGVTIKDNEATLCYLSNTGERVCKAIKAGTIISKTDFSRAAKEGSNAFMMTIASIKRGDPQIVVGETRSSSQIQGAPYGKILLRDGVLSISSNLFEKGIVEKFVVNNAQGKGIPVFESSLNNEKIIITSEILKRGRSYSWIAYGQNFSFSGKISIATEDELEKIQEKIQRINERKDLDKAGKDIITAETLLEEEFRYDANNILESLGLL